MLTSTKRYILHVISLTLAICCLATGLVMKYGSLEKEIPVVVHEEDKNVEFTSLDSDSLNLVTNVPPLSNPDD